MPPAACTKRAALAKRDAFPIRILMTTQPRRIDELFVTIAPAVFVLFWSTGFIGAKFGLPYAEPLTFLALRFAFVCPLLAVVAFTVRAEWPRGIGVWHNVVSGTLLHAMYLSGVFVAIHRGMPAGIAALLVGLQPILTSTLANRWLGETVRPLQWAGLVLGLIGLYFVVESRIGDGEASPVAWIAILIALVGVTIGTLYQKRFGGGGDLRAALPIQYGAALVLCGAGSLFFETGNVRWTGEFLFAVLWLSLVLSWGAIYLFYVLIRRTAAARLVSLFYLVPPVTALMSYFLFGERLTPLAIAGMVACGAGVFLVNWKADAPRA
jgi:drug/metabolite transporter (DMT)-like permease